MVRAINFITMGLVNIGVNSILHNIQDVRHKCPVVHESHQPSKLDNEKLCPIFPQGAWSRIACSGSCHAPPEIANHTERHQQNIFKCSFIRINGKEC